MYVTENAVCPNLLRSLEASWPAAEWPGWHQYHSTDSIKRASRWPISQLPFAAQRCLEHMATWLNTDHAFPDFELYGAGLHEIPPDGFLGRHLDSDHHPITGWKREYSVVLCVNSEWHPEWGGRFQIGSRQVVPQFNSLVTFRTTDDSWHEVTQVTGPIARRTLSLFFWSLEASQKQRSAARFA